MNADELAGGVPVVRKCWGQAFKAFVAESFVVISRDDCVMAQVAYTCISPIATPCPSTNFPQNFRAEDKCVKSVSRKNCRLMILDFRLELPPPADWLMQNRLS
ncbi:MAG: hypothetical protein GX811_05100 [Lentisphaerae bacterium]|nr:hypothetical protein [Lentisphaerota bacterium]